MRILFSLFLYLTFVSSFAQSLDWEWAKAARGRKDAFYFASDPSTCNDRSGNVYLTGSFRSPQVAFGDDTLLNFNSSGHSIFLLKYDSSGNLLWARSALGEGRSEAVTTDAEGNVYITGSFESDSISFDNFALHTLHGAAFIVKYDGDGNVLWAKSTKGIFGGSGVGIGTDANEDVYLTGGCDGPYLVFENDTVFGGFFIAKYSRSGDLKWLTGAGTDTYDNTKDICVDAFGNSYVTGLFSNTPIVGTDSIVGGGIFTACYDSAGNLSWAKNVGGYNASRDISIDLERNLYVTGVFYWPTIKFGNTTLTNAGDKGNIFVVKYSPEGNMLWAKSVGGVKGEDSKGITTDRLGNIYVVGAADDEDLSFENTIFDGWGLFVVKYDSDGNAVWVKGASTNFYPYYSSDICVDATGSVFVAGFFSDSIIRFGQYFLKSTEPGNPNIFLAKLSDKVSGIQDLPDYLSNAFAYPNPSSGNVYFRAVKSGSLLQVYDVLGNHVFSTIINNDNYDIDFTSKPKGIYFYRTTNENGLIQQGKIILE